MISYADTPCIITFFRILSETNHQKTNCSVFNSRVSSVKLINSFLPEFYLTPLSFFPFRLFCIFFLMFIWLHAAFPLRLFHIKLLLACDQHYTYPRCNNSHSSNFFCCHSQFLYLNDKKISREVIRTGDFCFAVFLVLRVYELINWTS